MNHVKRSLGAAEPWAAVVGLDWADQAHQVCLRGADGHGPPEDQVVEQKPAALEGWSLGC